MARVPSIRVAIEILDQGDVTPDDLWAMASLELLATRSREDTVNLGDSWATLRKVSRMNRPKLEKILTTFCARGWIQMSSPQAVTILLGRGSSTDESAESQVPASIPSPDPVPSPQESTTHTSHSPGKPANDSLPSDHPVNTWLKASMTQWPSGYIGVMAWWNTLAGELGLAKPTKLSDERKRRIRAKCAKDWWPALDDLEEAIRQQPFLHGENDRGWRLSMDALFERADLALKIVERKYGNGKGRQSGFDREKAKRLLDEAQKQKEAGQ